MTTNTVKPAVEEKIEPKAEEKPPERARQASAIVSRAKLRQQRGQIERWTAWVVLFASFLGTVVALAGGWPAFLGSLRAGAPPWSAVLGGFLIQGLLTYLQWYYYDRPLIAQPARIVDTVFTAWGYGPLFSASLIAALTVRGVPQPVVTAWLIVAVLAYLPAWYPESRLVDK